MLLPVVLQPLLTEDVLHERNRFQKNTNRKPFLQ